MEIRTIESPSNPRVRRLATLAASKGRREEGLFLAEGPRVLSAASAAGLEAEVLLLDSERYPSPPSRLPIRAREILVLSPRAFRKVSAVERSQGVAAAFALPELPPLRAPSEGTFFMIAACGVQDPGNMGALMRVAAACGCDAFAGVGSCADFFSPKVVRASAGAIFVLRMHRCGPDELSAFLRENGIVPVAAHQSALVTYLEFVFPDRSALLLGAEGRGLPPELLDGARKVSIPMENGVESLNVAVAAGILAFRARETRAEDV